MNFKACDDSALGRFWAALGCGLSSEEPGVTNAKPEGLAWPDPASIRIDVVAVPDPETVRYRVHLDLARLKGLGAADADIGQGGVPWKVLTDPEGNEFCVLALRGRKDGRG